MTDSFDPYDQHHNVDLPSYLTAVEAKSPRDAHFVRAHFREIFAELFERVDEMCRADQGSFIGLEATPESEPFLLTREINFDNEPTGEFYRNGTFAGDQDSTPIYYGYRVSTIPQERPTISPRRARKNALKKMRQDMILNATDADTPTNPLPPAVEITTAHTFTNDETCLTVYKDISPEDETPIRISVLIDENQTPTDPLPPYKPTFTSPKLSPFVTDIRPPAFEDSGHWFGQVTSYPS